MFGLSFIVSAKAKKIQKEKAKYAALIDGKPSRKKNGFSSVERIQQVCLSIAMDVAAKGEGCLIVIGKTTSYSELFPNFFQKSSINVTDKGMDKVLVQLAQIDGAIVIDQKGFVQAYGARLTKSSSHHGSGTRHSAAKGISEEKGTLAILASEEDHVVRIFKGGKQVVEINPHTKGVKNHLDKVVDFVNSPEGAVAAGAAIAIPLLGIPGVIVFAGSYYVAKNLLRFTGGEKQKPTKKSH